MRILDWMVSLNLSYEIATGQFVERHPFSFFEREYYPQELVHDTQ